MASNGKLLQPELIVVGVIVLILAASVASKPNSRCPRRCGGVKIPYPFGTSEDCSLDSTFLITCNNSSHPPKPSLRSGMFVEEILVLDGELRVSNPVASLCKHTSIKSLPPASGCPKRTRSPYEGCRYSTYSYHRPYTMTVNYSGNSALLKLSNFRISNKRNKITAVGCGVYSFIQGYEEDEQPFTTGCLSLCDIASNVVNGSCSGIGCCQTFIPKGATEFNLSVRIFNDSTKTIGSNECAFGFIVEEQAYNFSSMDFENLRGQNTLPLVLDWAVGNETCEEAKKNKESYACKAKQSYCYNSSNGPGYRCNCSHGYRGNPYLPDGLESCQDINECKLIPNPCAGNATCINTEGNYTCTCPHGYIGDGWISCRLKESQSSNIIPIALGMSMISLLIMVAGSSWVYWVMQRRKLIKLKQKFFQQNGGLILQQQLLRHKESVELTKIFSAEELEKATNNYDKGSVLGQGNFGTVYKGVLSNDRVIAVKKSKVVDQSQIEQFINEVLVLTKTNHKNVVKLIGCCLETQVPLLVYEFITNGTLYDHIHDKNLSSSLSWEKRLKIASEIAEALAYIHFETSISIIHRDVKTANILLDDKYTAKMSDFGASRLVPLDHTQLTTVVLGTLGYLDPEYFHTSQLTAKSDVYSFGVVIAELLTSQKAISLLRLESERNLATYFVTALKEGRLLQIIDDHILKERNIEEITKVANIAKQCLDVRGEDRPSMKQVTKELGGLRLSEKKKNSLEKVDSYTQQITKHLPNAPTHFLGIDVGIGNSSISTIVGDGNIRNQVLKPIDNEVG